MILTRQRALLPRVDNAEDSRSNIIDKPLNKLLFEIGELCPPSHEAMKGEVRDILNEHLLLERDTHNTNSVSFVFLYGGKKYLMKIELGCKTNSVRDEISWYEKTANSFTNCPDYLGSVSGKNMAAIILSFIESSSTIDELALQSRINGNQVWNLINKSVTLLNSLFKDNPKKEISLSMTNNFFVKKYDLRLKESLSYKYLRELFSCKNLCLNGQILPNFNFYISKIIENMNLNKILTPRIYGLIHGDLHCGNILVKGGKIYFVDPNGNLFMPIEYDYGKIFHSIHGGYGSIMRGLFELCELGKNEFEFSVQEPESYKSAFLKLSTSMPRDLFIRSLYCEAMHFVTMLPHHATNKKETKALFLRGIVLFKELFDFLQSN